MTNPIFPTLAVGQDSSLYGLEIEDKSMKTQLEGGYVVTRAKHTRKARRTFNSGFTMLKSPDRKTLDDFFELVNCSLIFNWTDPPSQVVYQVRFLEKMRFKYTGIGLSQRWDVAFSLEQA